MNNVLLIGNGFDVAHGLATSYNDFLLIMKRWPDFFSTIKDARKGRVIAVENPFFKFACNAKFIDEDNLNKLGDIIQRNSWVQYYCSCEAEIDGWIDFEREIYPVIDMFEFIFNSNYNIAEYGGEFGEAHINRNEFQSKRILRVAALWDKYINGKRAGSVYVKEPYVSKQYGILKKKILQDLRKEFDEFVQAFELYLIEFVYKRDDVKLLKQIKEIGITTVISFNYTLTEQLYGISEDDVHHIHGMIRKDLSIGKNTMVMGVNERLDQSMDFIYFVKYFQRIQKESGVKYKELIRRFTQVGMMMETDYILYVYGHSLDETDEDILKYVIGDKDRRGMLNLKPEKVIVFYYDDSDYEQKVINLIKLYGRPIVEEYMEMGLFKFEKTTDEMV